MKLNFEICKICDAESRYFFCIPGTFKFFCNICGEFFYDEEKFKLKLFHICYLEEITEKEWKFFQNIEIKEYYAKWFNRCPYKLEHIVEQDET